MEKTNHEETDPTESFIQPSHAITNMEKRQVYSVLKTKLRIAIQQEFFLEALLLEYAIIEDRLSSILRTANLKYQRNDGEEISIQQKINKIYNAIRNKHFPVYEHVAESLLADIIIWKKVRNDLVHKSCTRLYNNEEVKNCATLGEELVRQVSNTAQIIKRIKKRSETKKV